VEKHKINVVEKHKKQKKVFSHFLFSVSRKKLVKWLIVWVTVWAIRALSFAIDNAYAVSEHATLLEQGCEQRTFKVTAYYSPLSDQSFFYKGDYVAEARLNGKWIAWASGKPVFNWMIAAPSTYDFGSKIYLPGWGRWEVEDRWGAIVQAGERQQPYDRLDMRVWKWELWLIRWLTFGVKTIEWWYCPSTTEKLVYEDGSDAAVWFDLSSVPVYKNFFLMTLFIQQLEEWRNDVRVRELQKQLIALWYMQAWQETSFFGPETKKAVCTFQVDQKILVKDSERCWLFGEQTRYALRRTLQKKWLLPDDYWQVSTLAVVQDYIKNNYFTKKIETPIEQTLQDATWVQDDTIDNSTKKDDNLDVNESISSESSSEIAITSIKQTQVVGTLTMFLQAWQKHEQVSLLQEKLLALWYEPWDVTGYYSDQTKKAVAAFQQAHHIQTDWYQWSLTKQTRDILNKIDRRLLSMLMSS